MVVDARGIGVETVALLKADKCPEGNFPIILESAQLGLPIIRMTNIIILPGEKPLTLEQLISDTDHGLYMQTNRSWSIDDKRYNFQFGCEMGWEIKNGKRARMLKNPSYSGITTEFWNSMDAICSRDEWTLWGTPNCGKGQPQQVMGTGHGASPARFRKVKVGSAYKGN